MEPLKNHLSPALVGVIASHLARHRPGFDAGAFVAAVSARLPDLELKERAALIADHLHAHLPPDLPRRFATLRAMLHPDEDARLSRQSDERGLCGWAILPLCAVVGRHGLAAFDEALLLLREMTKRFSAEFDVRPFLIADQARALALMQAWVGDPSRHVRRLVSEGTRPRLPWAMRLPALMADPAPILPLLAALRDDPDEYVRRSVANSLNDIAKDHPDLVAGLARDWMAGATAERERLLRHACRSLIKQGHPGALAVFGLGAPMVDLVALELEAPALRLGQSLGFTAILRSRGDADQPLVIDYVLHFCRANGSRSAKVFKWKRLTLRANETLRLGRLHPIVPITTRRYHAGRHALALRINGQDTAAAEFLLEV